MAEIIGNVMILVFKDGTLNVTAPFSPMAVLKILGMAAQIVADHELKKEQSKQAPTIKPLVVLPDKYKVQ